MLENGAMVGVYRVARFLGAGGMGSVYEVTHTAMHTRHAMKVLADQYLRSPGVRERFRREAELMYTLRANPHIVGATDVIDTPNLVALVLDLVDGGDLGEALDQRPGGLPWTEAWRILAPITSAVAFAHERNVVHRDLKPENVLLRREGPWPGVPLVADFGIAKVIGSESATRTQARMGTACYGAPEQFKNAKEVGAQADVWSLGMLAWRLVTGTLPVDPEDNVAIIKLYEGLVPVPRLEGVPEHVAVAVAAALQPDPTQRPFNAGVMQKLLTAEAALEQPPVFAPRNVLTSPAETGRPPESGRKGLWLGLGVGAALSAAIVGLAVGGRGSPAAVSSAPEPTPGPAATPAVPATVGPTPTVPDGFVRIEPDTFTMGSPGSEEGRDADEVQHQVTLTRAFWLGRTEVTQGQWREVMGTPLPRFDGCGPECPVASVSWGDAVTYLNKLSDREGLERCYGPTFKGLACSGYRLPTEAEWEYAARAGTTSARYGDLSPIAWSAETAGGRPRMVGTKAPNPWGLRDMLGNLWEWTGDWYDEYGGPVVDPVGPATGTSRVIRGGSWNGSASSLRAADRLHYSPGERDSTIGFRVARSAP
jgi:formylglycine-generating enzyme required for sulfatase activity/tRNA A-37 threonylcarbamoyl transferase component Bud32